ncbi:MAG: prephenate dehydrogenase [Bacillota bacterium]
MEDTELFGTVAIVGLGLMGGSLGMALRERRRARRVLGADADPAALRDAARLGAIDQGGALEAVVSQADLVVLATPVPVLAGLLRQIGPHLRSTAVVTDLGSVKRPVLDAAAALPRPERFVGGHPLAGREHSGVAAAHGDLFLGRAWAVVPGPSSLPGAVLSGPAQPQAVETVTCLARTVGADPIVLDADEHDRLAAGISHLPQLAAYALALAVAAGADSGPTGSGAPAGLDLARRMAGPGLRDTTRLAASPARLWRDLALFNRDHLTDGLRRLQAELAEVSKALEAGDGDALEGLFARARAARLALFP